MKRIGVVMCMLLLAGACSKEKVLDFFLLPSVRSVRVPDIEDDFEELYESVAEYEREIQRQIDAGDKLRDVYKALGVRYLHRENWEMAIESLMKSISFGKSSDRVHHMLGTAYANRGREMRNASDYRDAVYHYELALEKNQENSRARFGLAMVLFYGLENEERAIREIEHTVHTDPELYDARFAHARMLYDLDRKNESLRAYHNLVRDLEGESSAYNSYLLDARENVRRLTTELSGHEIQ